MKNATRQNGNRFMLYIDNINHNFVIVTTRKKEIINNGDLVFFQQGIYQYVNTNRERRHTSSGILMIMIIKLDREVLSEYLTDKDAAVLSRFKLNVLIKEHNHNDRKVYYASFWNKAFFGQVGMSSLSSYALITKWNFIYSRDDISVAAKT